ncbi:hypothetical protein SESBI_12584 [Sesbania bispinosa]|nr:hypothetical protein SESBI_12584 [Sesbania bispinosa]
MEPKITSTTSLQSHSTIKSGCPKFQASSRPCLKAQSSATCASPGPSFVEKPPNHIPEESLKTTLKLIPLLTW